MTGTILAGAFFVLVPAVALWLEKRVRVVAVMGSVALCYLIGFVVGNTPGLPVDSKLTWPI